MFNTIASICSILGLIVAFWQIWDVKKKLKSTQNALNELTPLGIERRPIESKKNKSQWRELKDTLTEARKKTIDDVLKTVSESRLIAVPSKITYWMDEAEKEE